MSIDPAILRALQAAGATTDMIIAAVEADVAMEKERRSRKRANNAERQRRYKAARKAESNASNALPALDGVTDVTPPSPQSPPLKVSPDPFKESPPLTPQPVVGRRAKPKFAPPEGVGLEQWEAFCQQRKKKLTDHAYSLVCGKLHTLAEAGWPPGKMIDLAIERGWETVFPPKDRPNDHRPANDRSEPQNPMVRAVIAAERQRRAGEQSF